VVNNDMSVIFVFLSYLARSSSSYRFTHSWNEKKKNLLKSELEKIKDKSMI